MVLKLIKGCKYTRTGKRSRTFYLPLSQTQRMKRIIFLLILSGTFALSSCNLVDYKRVKGNGVIITQTRNVENVHKIKLAGIFDLDITPGTETAVLVEADENLQPYIITKKENGYLVIKLKDYFKLINVSHIKVHVTTDRLEEVVLSGSGNITGKGKFTGADKMKVKVSGIGNLSMEINTPEIEADLTGSGSITLSGETRSANIDISGIGNYNADSLKTETSKVKIAGNGDARVYADRDLNVRILGNGSVLYKGAASITQKITGNGEIKRIE